MRLKCGAPAVQVPAFDPSLGIWLRQDQQVSGKESTMRAERVATDVTASACSLEVLKVPVGLVTENLR